MTEQIRAAFDSIHADEALKQRTRAYLAESVNFRRRGRSGLFRLALAAACLVLSLCAGGSYLYFTPTAYISVDVNPSLELGVNRFDRVVSVESYNEDGQMLAETLDVKYLNYRDALEQILDSESMTAYLQDGLLSLTVAGESERQCGEIYQAMEDCAAGRRNIRCHAGSSDTVREAHHSGMSVGRYQAYLILRELNPDITEEEIRAMTMREIEQLIRSSAQEQGVEMTPAAEPAGGYAHGGYGHGHGRHHGAGNSADS